MIRRTSFLGSFAAAVAAPRIALAASASIPLQVGAMLLDTAGQAYYAADNGFFADAGLDAKVNVMNNGAAILAGVLSGSLDIGFASPASLVQARERGIPIRFVAPGAVGSDKTLTTGLMVLKDASLKSARDLEGKTVAVAGLRDITQFMTMAWLDRNGANLASVQFIEIPYAEMAPALQQGRVAAACMIEPHVTAAKATCRTLAALDTVLGHRYMQTGWTATEPWIAANADALARFRSAIRRSARWANDHHEQSAPILARYTKMTPEQIAGLQRSYYDDAALNAALIQPSVDLIVKYGKLAPMSASDLIAG
jgi:NitT/TauT family transport system substrate-binding protein